MKKTIITMVFVTLATCILQAQNGVYLGTGSSMRNSIVWGNTDQVAGDGTVSHSAVEGALIEGTGNISLAVNPFVGAGITGLDPYHIAAEATTIDAGDGSIANGLQDAAGHERIWGAIIDMGAYEHQFPRAVSVAAVDTFKMEGEADPELEYIVSGHDLLKGDVLEVSMTRTQGETANTYAITGRVKVLRPAAGIDVTHLYALAFQPGVFTVESTVELPEINNAMPVRIYPAVTDGILYIDGVENQANVSIYNLSGIQVMHQVLTNNDNTIDISALRSGTLIVRVYDSKTVETKKIIKK